MNDRNIFFGIIGLLVIAVIGLAVDRSNQITSLTEQIDQAATQAQEASDNMSATIEAQSVVAETQVADIEMAQEDAEAQANLAATSEASAILLQEDMVEIEDTVTAFESVNADLATEVADLSEQRDGLTTDKDDLSTQVADVSTERDDAVAANDTMATEVADLSTQRDDLTSQVDALSTQVAESVPTEEPTPEPTIEADSSASSTGDIEAAVQFDVSNSGTVKFSPDGSSIAVLRDDNVIQLFSASDGTPQIELAGFDGDLSGFIYAADGRSMAAVVDNTNIAVFDSATASISFEDEYSNPIIGYDFSADGDAIAIGTRQNIEIALFDSPQKQTSQTGVTSLDWSADGTMIVISNGRSVSVLDIADNVIENTNTLDTSGAAIVDIYVSPDGTSIAGITVDAELVMISAESGSVVWQTALEVEDVDGVAWSGDSQHLAVVSDGDVRVYGVDGSWTVQTTVDGANAVDWSADSEFIVLATADQISIIEVASLME